MHCPACNTPNAAESRFCAHCGAKMPPAKAGTEIEVVEDVERRPRRAVDEDEERRPRPMLLDEDEGDDEPGTVATIIPYRNGKALASYYLGVLSLIVSGGIVAVTGIAVWKREPSMLAFYGPIAPLGLVLGPLALLLGILGLRSAILNPAAKGKGHAVLGTIFGLLTVVLSPAALIYFMMNLDDNTRLLKEFWKVVGGR